MDTDGRPKRMLARIRERYPIVMHGVSLSIGTIDPINSDYLKKLKALAEWAKPAWISDHLCWTGVAHKNTHDLLPVPFTEEALQHVVNRIRMVQDVLERPILIENPSSYLEFTDSHMPEYEFLARMAEAADCGLLLDVNNIYVASFNHRQDPKAYLDAIPAERVVQVHLAGHTHKGTHIIDTHDDHVIDEVWALYRYLLSRTGPVNTMVEWDDKIPAFEVVWAEVEKAKKIAEAPEAPNALPHFAKSKEYEAVPAHWNYEMQLYTLQGAILEGDAAAAGAEKWITPKPDFPPQEQLQSYINGYRYRLFDIVHDEYPVLRHYLGDKKMDTLIKAFVVAQASTHFNIARYNFTLPAFTKLRLDAMGQELSELETVISLLFHAEESEALTPAHIEGMAPEELMESILLPRKALRLMKFNYPVNQFYIDTMEEKEPGMPEPAACYLAVYRHEDRIWRLELEEAEYKLLTQLFAGKTVGEALEGLIAENPDGAEQLVLQLSPWFARWMQNGLLAAHHAPIETPIKLESAA